MQRCNIDISNQKKKSSSKGHHSCKDMNMQMMLCQIFFMALALGFHSSMFNVAAGFGAYCWVDIQTPSSFPLQWPATTFNGGGGGGKKKKKHFHLGVRQPPCNL